jgi:hypothetical protein
VSSDKYTLEYTVDAVRGLARHELVLVIERDDRQYEVVVGVGGDSEVIYSRMLAVTLGHERVDMSEDYWAVPAKLARWIATDRKIEDAVDEFYREMCIEFRQEAGVA